MLIHLEIFEYLRISVFVLSFSRTSTSSEAPRLVVVFLVVEVVRIVTCQWLAVARNQNLDTMKQTQRQHKLTSPESCESGTSKHT